MSEAGEYLAHRGLVMRLAYDITGSWSDAEDVSQQTYVRWRGVRGPVEHPRAYLARIATHLALDAVARRDKVGYPGPFLPEPVFTGPGADDLVAVAAEVEMALMVVLGALSPLERAAFLLHDVFGFSHPEVAAMLGREPAAVRQLTSRSRRHVQAHRPDPGPIDAGELAALTDAFLGAARQGDVAALASLLTRDVVVTSDGGGRRSAARRPVVGRTKAALLFAGLARHLTEQIRIVPVWVNHRPALALYDGDVLDQVVWFVARDGLIAQVFSIRNPDKLVRLDAHLSA